MISSTLSSESGASYGNDYKDQAQMITTKLTNIEKVLKSQLTKKTTSIGPYSHLVKPSMLTERAKFEIFCDKHVEAHLEAEKFKLSTEIANHHEDILSTQNIEKLLKKYHVNIPKKGFYCPHFHLWVGKKKLKENADTRISDEQFENIAIMVFHEWVINWLFMKQFVLESPQINLTEGDAILYGLYGINRDACYDAMLKYFGPFSVQFWSEAKKKFLQPENLLRELSHRVYRTIDTSIAVKNMKLEAREYIISKRMPRIKAKVYDTICCKKTPPHLSKRKGCLDRIAEKMDSADVKERYEMIKKLSKDSKYKLRKKGVEIPNKGELIASMSNDEFDEWCKDQKITRANKSYYKRRYRYGK